MGFFLRRSFDFSMFIYLFVWLFVYLWISLFIDLFILFMFFLFFFGGGLISIFYISIFNDK